MPTWAASPRSGYDWGQRAPRWAGITSKVVEVGGTRVHYLRAGSRGGAEGSGPTHLLIHPMGTGAWSWMDVIGPLAATGPVIAPDLPGSGRSRPIRLRRAGGLRHGTSQRRPTCGRRAALCRSLCDNPHMATNLDIDPRLLQRALELSGERTKTAAVTRALQEYVARREQKRLLELFGALEWDGRFDYKAERSRA